MFSQQLRPAIQPPRLPNNDPQSKASHLPFASGINLRQVKDLGRPPSMQKSHAEFVQVKSIIERRDIKSSHVGTRRRPALLGQINK